MSVVDDPVSMDRGSFDCVMSGTLVFVSAPAVPWPRSFCIVLTVVGNVLTVTF